MNSQEFKANFFSKNRQNLLQLVPDHLIVITAHRLLQFSADTAFPFRQDAHFWYLSGIDEPDLVLVIEPNGECTLYLPERNKYQQDWDGGLNHQELQKISGITQYRPIGELEHTVRKALKKGLCIGSLEPLPEIVEPYGFYANPARSQLYQTLKKFGCKEIADIRLSIARLRMIKQPAELSAIQKAIEITGLALEKVKKNLHTYESEKDVERALSASFYEHGADGHAFEPIVASGKHATTVHYNQNSDKIAKNELLLLDVGARYQGYCADISRVWSVGKLQKKQQEIYAVLVELQDYAISLLKPGVLIREYQKTVEKEVQKKLAKLNVLEAKETFPHGFSHFLGLDVHDAGVYDEPLEPGSVLTVEPGLYLKSLEIGVRVEDDILITKDGNINLSSAISRELI